jgi:ElaB/YqjD/DUF883 family membrane-anchored ribosome-binding protein
MENHPEVIRRQMEETRTSLQDKLENLEQKVIGTVQDATDAAAETVQTVKETVEETVETVKETVGQTVESVKRTFSLRNQVNEHPWPMFLGAAAAGYVAGHMLFNPRERAARQPQGFFASAVAADPAPPRPQRNGVGTSPPQTEKGGFWNSVASHYHDELAKLQGLAVGAAASLVRDLLISSAAPALKEQIEDIVDSVTAKLGGKPIHGSVFPTEPSASPPADRPRFDRSNNVEPLIP